MSVWLHLQRRWRGRYAEKIAADFLMRQGFVIVARNYRCRLGEIDLIAREGDTLVFVEVRFRSRSDYGNAIESITNMKRRKLIAAALYFLQERGDGDSDCRFDVIALSHLSPDVVEWIPNAFDAGQYFR